MYLVPNTYYEREQMTTLEIAEKVENVIHLAFSMKGEAEGFNLDRAMLVGVKTDGDKVVDINPEIASHGDVYQLLDDEDNFAKVASYNVVGLVTCGWAAPLNSDGELDGPTPASHPQRRRVRLMVCASLDGMASVLRFQDESDNPISDGGQATGPLAEALQDFLIRSKNL
jgi:hypothetical protein